MMMLSMRMYLIHRQAMESRHKRDITVLNGTLFIAAR